MSISILHCASIFLLLIRGVVGDGENTEDVLYRSKHGRKAPITSCCKETKIAYSEEIMMKCEEFSNKADSKANEISSPPDFASIDLCQIQCYLNKSGIIDKDGDVQGRKFAAFLHQYLPNDKLSEFVNNSTHKCLRKLEHIKNWELAKKNCQPYYGMLLGCIQETLFIKCLNASESWESYSDYSDNSDISSGSGSYDWSSEYDSDYDDSDSGSYYDFNLYSHCCYNNIYEDDSICI